MKKNFFRNDEIDISHSRLKTSNYVPTKTRNWNCCQKKDDIVSRPNKQFITFVCLSLWFQTRNSILSGALLLLKSSWIWRISMFCRVRSEYWKKKCNEFCSFCLLDAANLFLGSDYSIRKDLSNELKSTDPLSSSGRVADANIPPLHCVPSAVYFEEVATTSGSRLNHS